MDQVRKALAQIKAQLADLTVSQKLLISSLVVIVLMALFVVTQYAGSRQMVELAPGLTPEQQAGAVEFLRTNNIEHRQRNNQLLVPAEQRYSVLGQMQQRGALPDDTTLLFDSMLDRQSWTMSSAQHRQVFMIAKQNELARVIGGMKGIRAATVMIDAPPRTGLGQSVRLPTASATVFTASGAPLDQQTVDAVAHLIAGAEAGLDINRVRVIDGSTNRQLRARDDTDAMASSYVEHQSKIEGIYRGRLVDLLQYIDGVIVAVSAQVDVRRTTSQTTRVLNPGEGTVVAPQEEISVERTERSASRAGEPGVRSNTGLDIAGGSAGAPGYEETQLETRMQTRFGQTVENVVDPRGMPTKINATINIPRAYFVRLWRVSGAGGEGDTPSDEQIAGVIEAETERIRADVGPLIESGGADVVTPGVVTVSMIPDPAVYETARAGGFMGALASGDAGAGGSLTLSGPVKTLAMLVLAGGALGLMALSLRKASKRQELPSPEELVGVPPSLHMHSDIVGEADEADSALTGIELSEDDLHRAKVQEQVIRLVKEQPNEAAGILNQWITEGH